MIDKATDRVKNYITEFPDSDIWIISKNKKVAELYWKILNSHMGCKVKPIFLSTAIDGLNPEKAVILLCGEWYFNPIAETSSFKYYLHNARKTFQFGEFPIRKDILDKYHI